MRLAAAAAAANQSDDGGAVRFYCSSGGNAGLACATTAVALDLPATIVIPTTTSAFMKGKLLDLGVQVHQVGKNWAAADRYMREELMAKDPGSVYVPPFDDPRVWEGHASIIGELTDQMEVPIHAIVCSVGGGGLVNGLMQGVEERSWSATSSSSSSSNKPRIVAVETIGADSLNASVRAKSHVTLAEITSIATTLGATRVSEQTWQWSQTSSNLLSLVVPDADAAISCVRFADEARILVEASCGATLAVAYRGDLRKHLGEGLTDAEWAEKNVVLEVCGGSGVTLAILEAYRDKYAGESMIQL